MDVYYKDLDSAKENAAKEALKYINDAEIIGVGTGSTVEKFIDLLSRVYNDYRDRYFTASSIDTMLKLRKIGFKVLHQSIVDHMDVYIDGADEVDGELNMVKGGGAALTLEKILAYYSRKRVFIVDYTKIVKYLGEKHPIPLEVIPQALAMVYKILKDKGYNPTIRYPVKGKYGPVIADTGGVIIDIRPGRIDPLKLEMELKTIPGIVETGLFINFADIVIVGYKDKVDVRSRARSFYEK
ncbi:MAG: ribose-5-phosphate isomerase RpiA [Desulfurococcales archaeon]|nr:ribose-5-phosphate isomerase RpiA [Desulfurococcales archaeon]